MQQEINAIDPDYTELNGITLQDVSQSPIIVVGNHGLDEKAVPHEWPGIWNPAVAMLKQQEEEGATYEGPINPANGLKFGFGKLTYKDGAVYQGQFIDGLKHGEGKMTSKNGVVFEGKFENDLMHGEGKMTFPNCSGI